MESPAIRNSWTRVALRRIRALPSDDRHAVLDAISRATQNRIARAKSEDWLPAECSVEVCEALVNALGRERSIKFWYDVVYDSWVGGLLEPLTATLADGGLGLIAVAPRAWELSALNCGEVVVVGDGSAVKLEARDLPPMIRDSLGIQIMYVGALEAMLAFSKLGAKIEIQAPDTGPLAFRLVFGPSAD